MATSRSPRGYEFLIAAALVVLASEAAQAQPTDIAELVMYGIDTDTDQLLRYNFETGEVSVVNVVPPGAHVEALGWFPDGPYRGMYGVAAAVGLPVGTLLRLHPFDGSSRIIMDLGRRVTGGVGYYDSDLGRWVLLLAEKKKEYLFTVDLQTGDITIVFPDCQVYQGLAIGPDGLVYACTETELWTVNLSTGVETKVGDMPGTTKCEALEFAFGDDGPAITVPGVPPAWTQNGLLVGFDDDTDNLLIIDPSSADVIRYASAAAATDVEGIVFMTKATDPIGKVVVDYICD